MFKYVFNFLRDTGALALKQSGFMPGDATVYQLAHLYHIFSDAIDRKKTVRCSFVTLARPLTEYGILDSLQPCQE